MLFLVLKLIFRLSSQYKQKSLSKRCPECYLYTERSFYCPCDDFNTLDIGYDTTSYCKVSMSQCVET